MIYRLSAFPVYGLKGSTSCFGEPVIRLDARCRKALYRLTGVPRGPDWLRQPFSGLAETLSRVPRSEWCIIGRCGEKTVARLEQWMAQFIS
jgi:hypothetical protein